MLRLYDDRIGLDEECATGGVAVDSMVLIWSVEDTVASRHKSLLIFRCRVVRVDASERTCVW